MGVKSKRREKPDTSTMAAASSEPEMRRDTVVNISEGTNMTTVHGDDAATNLVTVHANSLIMRESGEVQPEMNPRAPPPPYQEHNDFPPLISSQTPPVRPIFHSSIFADPPSSFSPPPPRSSPPPAYSQLDLSGQILRAAPPQNPLGGATRHLPSQHGGARPKKLHLQQQQMTNKEITAALRKVGGLSGLAARSAVRPKQLTPFFHQRRHEGTDAGSETALETRPTVRKFDPEVRKNLTEFGQYVAECLPKYVQKAQLTSGDELEILIAPQGSPQRPVWLHGGYLWS